MLTDNEFTAPKPGHVVRHAGKTVIFADGTGEVTVFDPTTLGTGTLPAPQYKTPEPHHGVAVELANGELVTTIGNEDERPGIAVLDKDRKEIARNDQCPGVHGEAAARGEAVVIGCETGVLIYKNGTITKVASPDPYGRIGNQAGSDNSPITLGDYKMDEAAELERPGRNRLCHRPEQEGDPLGRPHIGHEESPRKQTASLGYTDLGHDPDATLA